MTTEMCDQASLTTSRFCSSNIDVTNFLNLNSLQNHSDYCLAYMFTYRDFTGGTLGLAWVGSDSSKSPVSASNRSLDLMKAREARFTLGSIVCCHRSGWRYMRAVETVFREWSPCVEEPQHGHRHSRQLRYPRAA